MAIKNSLAKQGAKQSLSTYLSQDAVTNKINEVIGGTNGQRFITAIVSATSQNKELQNCTNSSILSAALLGESLLLSPSPQLGHYYMVPFKNNNSKSQEAQFILGYKGYVQLAIRSGNYKKLNVVPIKDGELISFNPLEEEIEVRLIDDEVEREKAKTVGYYAMFEYTNGFRKALYWSKEKMEAHAMNYSAGYKKDKAKGTNYTFWSKDFDGMACKTMIRQLISKWGIMSIEMQKAYESDMAVINDDLKPKYVDTEEVIEENPESFEKAEVIEVESEEGNNEELLADEVADAFFNN